jgi:hypothetical protein
VIQFLALVAVALVLAMKQMTRPTRYLITATSSVVIITCVYSTWVGGDAWEWSKCFNRYIAVSLPAGTIGVILAFASSPSHKHQNELLALNANALMFSMSIGLIFAVSMSSLLQPTDWLPLSLGIVFLTFILVFSLHNPSFSAMQRGGISMSAVALLVFITTSAIPGESWLRKNGLHVSDDHALTARSHALNEVTKQEAVIATVWAGAPAYYSRRKMIDLLGKSDRVIAGRPPKGELHPGHNKWDYLYSIGELRPDVVFQLWRHTDEDLKLLQSWGYVLRCNNKVGAVYYLSQSDQVNWEKLQDCP